MDLSYTRKEFEKLAVSDPVAKIIGRSVAGLGKTITKHPWLTIGGAASLIGAINFIKNFGLVADYYQASSLHQNKAQTEALNILVNQYQQSHQPQEPRQQIIQPRLT